MAGCPIPVSGDPVTLAICMPDGWQGLISELLVPPRELPFWDDQATLEDREVARRTAETIIGQFQSDECLCPEYTNGPSTFTQTTWDFGASSHGFSVVAGGYGVYQNGVWESVKWEDQLTGYWHSELHIERPLSPSVWPLLVKAYTALLCSSGPMLTFPSLSMYLRSSEADPVGAWRGEFSAGYWEQATFRPTLQCQAYRSIKADLIEFSWSAVAASESIIDSTLCTLSKIEFDYDLPT